jgi:septum formation protein
VSQREKRAPLLLASASPRRRELLVRVGIDIEVQPADVDETPQAGEEPLAYARRVARAKADVVAARAPDRWVLAADTVVEIGGAILGKAPDPAAALAMLDLLSGRTHQVLTAFVLRGPGGQVVAREVATEVALRAVPGEELAAYVRAGEWQGKAGAYAAQGMAAAFVAEVRGSFTNVVGLPLVEVLEELVRVGAASPDYGAGVPS